MRNVDRNYACMCKDGDGTREEDDNSEVGGDRNGGITDYESTVDQRGYLGECEEQVYSRTKQKFRTRSF